MGHPTDDRWTEPDILQETVANLESLNGVVGVRWRDVFPADVSGLSDALIRIETVDHRVLRIALRFYFDEAEANAFDTHFVTHGEPATTGRTCQL